MDGGDGGDARTIPTEYSPQARRLVLLLVPGFFFSLGASISVRVWRVYCVPVVLWRALSAAPLTSDSAR